jgi:hypothetical protein
MRMVVPSANRSAGQRLADDKTAKYLSDTRDLVPASKFVTSLQTLAKRKQGITVLD